jgi:hypothetical protein
MKKCQLLYLIFLINILQAHGQTKNKEAKNYSDNPLWIEMMDDTLTNFFDAQKSFQAYWEIRPKPIEEEELIGRTEIDKEERKKWLQQIFNTKRLRYKEESEKYAFQYKRFKHWERANLPYVQDDGRILTPSERIAIWQQKQKNK